MRIARDLYGRYYLLLPDSLAREFYEKTGTSFKSFAGQLAYESGCDRLEWRLDMIMWIAEIHGSHRQLEGFLRALSRRHRGGRPAKPGRLALMFCAAVLLTVTVGGIDLAESISWLSMPFLALAGSFIWRSRLEPPLRAITLFVNSLYWELTD